MFSIPFNHAALVGNEKKYMEEAMLLAQLEQFQTVYEKRKALWERYRKGLKSWAERQSVRIPVIPDNCQQAYHLFYLILPSENCRDRFIAYMREHGIHAFFTICPCTCHKWAEAWAAKKAIAPLRKPSARNWYASLCFAT